MSLDEYSARECLSMARYSSESVDSGLIYTRKTHRLPTRSTLYLISLCMGLGGLQGVFAVLFGHGSVSTLDRIPINSAEHDNSCS